MKNSSVIKIVSAVLAAVLLVPSLLGCAGTKKAAGLDDGRARPSNSGRLKVADGRLCSESGEPVMLRGIGTNSLITCESFLNEALFSELAEDGVNVIRLAMYTYGVGVIGYCTGGDRERHLNDIGKGVELARANDMYVIIDWHILSDGDPNSYIEEAKLFFQEMAEKYKGYDNVLYEICNEPNGVDWASVKRYAEEIIPVIREKDPASLIIVGTPDWSKDLASAAADPLPYENIMYTLHFYSASHGEDVRSAAKQAMDGGLPVFVTEFGITASSGDHPRDIESADEWIALLESEHVSWCMWSLSNAPEASAFIRSTVLKYSGYAEEDYSPTGIWFLDTLKKYTGKGVS